MVYVWSNGFEWKFGIEMEWFTWKQRWSSRIWNEMDMEWEVRHDVLNSSRGAISMCESVWPTGSTAVLLLMTLLIMEGIV